MFNTCQLDGASFINRPSVEWYEMHIYCKNCLEDYKKIDPPLAQSIVGPMHGQIKNKNPDTSPGG